MQTTTEKRRTILIFGMGLLAINTILWLHLLFEIKRMRLPVNCDGAWPADLPLVVFIAVLLLILLAYVARKGNLKNQILIDIALIDSIILMLFIYNSGVVAMCDCSDPKIIEWSYAITSFIYVFDTLVKTHMLFTTTMRKKE